MQIGIGIGLPFALAPSLYGRVAVLFAAGQQGAWYAPSDFSTMFQDSAGTTPVTAVEQPVGNIKDKSGRGNHAIQAAAAARPVLSSRVNLLTKTADFTNATWIKERVTIGAGTLIEDTSVTQTHRLTETTTTVSSGVKYAISGAVKLGTRGFAFLGLTGTAFPVTAVSINLTTGAVTTAVGTPLNVLTVADGDGYWRVSFELTATANGTAIPAIYISVDGVWANRTYTGDGVSYIFAKNPQLELNIATRHQSVDTASSYDTAGFPLYEKFDGVDDSLSSATGGGGSAGFFLCQAIKPTGGAGTVRTLWSDTGTDTGYRVRLNAANQLELAAAQTPTYGATLITNGDFATDTVWAKGAGWTIAAGLATGAASNTSITQAVTVTAGKRYEITYTVVTPTAGTVQMQLQGGTVVSGTARGTAGTYTEVLTAAAGNITLGFLGATWSGSIDNVIIREITYYVLATTTATADVGVSNVVTVWDDGTNLNAQIGSGTVASVARPTVLAGSAGFTLGKDNGAATSFFTGNGYAEVYRKDSGLTAAERAQVKAYVASMAGVTL